MHFRLVLSAMVAVLLLLTGAVVLAAPPLLLITRTYWTVSVLTLASGANKHTHVAVTGRVAYVAREADGDLHMRLAAPDDSTLFIVAECIPALPCAKPVKGTLITVYGISRKDSEHGWSEVHPVERWEAALAP